MTSEGCTENGSAGPAILSALAALDAALLPAEGAVTAATETRLQTALYFLRTGGERPDLVAELEGVAASLRLMVEAKRTGRPNLYASKLVRLRRLRAAASGL
ncbi:MAG TPA: hypothetical protein VGB79_04485 [Allosphingosinicella sp.]